MNMQSSLVILQKLAQNDVEKSAIQLKQARNEYQQTKQQLNMLMHYQVDYRCKFQATLKEGITNTNCQNFQEFIQTLNVAIDHHQKQLQNWHLRLDILTNSWKEKQKKLYAFNTLQERKIIRECVKENRLNQKKMDEFAQRASLRKTDL